MPDNANLILLDGNQRSALAVTRSIGKRGIRIIAGAETVSSLSSFSRYCKDSFLYPSPYEDRGSFIEFLKNYIKSHNGAVLFPMTDVTMSEVLENRDYFERYVRLPFVTYETYAAASDKRKLCDLARSLNIPMPQTISASDFNTKEEFLKKVRVVGFPVVVKPVRSKVRLLDRWIDCGVKYALNEDELVSIMNVLSSSGIDFLIQERICGYGSGVFVMARDGEILNDFSHRRIREKPPSGGVSALSESIRPHPIALESARKLIKALGWQGIAMIEFRMDEKDDLPKLIEMNGRFWGSLQLAVYSGVDFPYMLYCMATDKKIETENRYKTGVRMRWELGDLDYLFISLRRRGKLLPVSTSMSMGRVMMNFLLGLFNLHIKNEIFQLDDLIPFIFEVKQYVKNLMRWRRN